MKIVIGENRVALVGKAWEIREKLKEYSRSYRTVQEWIDQEKGKQKKKKMIPLYLPFISFVVL